MHMPVWWLPAVGGPYACALSARAWRRQTRCLEPSRPCAAPSNICSSAGRRQQGSAAPWPHSCHLQTALPAPQPRRTREAGAAAACSQSRVRLLVLCVSSAIPTLQLCRSSTRPSALLPVPTAHCRRGAACLPHHPTPQVTRHAAGWRSPRGGQHREMRVEFIVKSQSVLPT
jgi:hypothetical protein